MTGSGVADTPMLMSGIGSPARPMLRRNGTVVSARAARLTATVIPENRTERPAVPDARRTDARRTDAR
jgi:hypothetical protein